jgi:hypothetical protein
MIAFSYWENISGYVYIVFIIIISLCLLNKSILKYPFFIVSFTFFFCISNIIHRFSHMRECENNYFINFLQKLGILCSHQHHSLHHTSPYMNYCVISEYNNYILNSINFWGILESIVYFSTGIKSNLKPSYNDYKIIHNHLHENSKLKCPDKPTKQDIEELKKILKKYKNCKK